MKLSVKSCLICFRLSWSEGLLCHSCKNKLKNEELIEREEQEFMVFSLLHYLRPLEDMVALWKSPCGEKYLRTFAAILAQKMAWGLLEPVTGVIPMPAKIPLGKDHAYIIAEEIANYFKAPLAPGYLERISGEPQKTKNIFKRRYQSMNLKVEFTPGVSKEGLWLFVDDIITTGSTLNNAWSLLGRPRAVGLALASRPKFNQ